MKQIECYFIMKIIWLDAIKTHINWVEWQLMSDNNVDVRYKFIDDIASIFVRLVLGCLTSVADINNFTHVKHFLCGI